MLHFDRSTVKHGTQNILNDCHQWLSDSFRVHQIRFRLGLCPGPRLGSLQHSSRPLAGLRGPTSNGEGKGKGKGGRGERKREGRGRKREGTAGNDPLTQFLYMLLRTIHQENYSWLVNSILDLSTLVNTPTNRQQ